MTTSNQQQATHNEFDLKGITWDHIRGYNPLHASVKPYEDETGIRIIWKKRSLKDFGDVSVEQLAREYDLVILDHPHSGTVASSRCIVPFDEILDKDILCHLSLNSVGPSYESYHYNNHQWALPIDAACQVASYAKELLTYRVPQSWPEVFELADHLKLRKQYIGMALCATDCNCSFLTLCAQQGDAPSEHKDGFVSASTGYHALNTLRKLYRVCHPGSSSWNPIKLYDHMTSQNDVLYCPMAFGYTNYSRSEYSPHRLHFSSIPGTNGAVLGGAGIAVSSYSKNIPIAAQYAAWLCSEKFQATTYVEADGQPAHKNAWLNMKNNTITGAFFSNTLSTIENAYVRPRTPHWPMFQEKLGDIIYLYLRDGKDIDKTWKEITDCYNHYFEKR